MADSSPAHETEPLDRETLIVAGVVMLGAIMSILDTTVVNVAIDRLAVDFKSSLTTIQWVVTGYTLALAAVIPMTGWAADRFGTKRLYLILARALHDWLDALRPGLERGVADPLPRPAGRRRRDDHAGGDDDHHAQGGAAPHGTGDGCPRACRC